MAQLKYRPEIDGLRSIAVLSVVLYHAGFVLFGGGYVGVDVFFVISGYLITNLIVREIRETGEFRFGRFYLRRIRRLFPALFCTTLVSWVLAFMLFSPSAMQEFAASAIAGLTSVSNFYFWHEADYFDAAAVTKPLLHTWSLSVEEQFYFIWPAFILLVLVKLRTSMALLVIAVLGAGSLMLAEYWIVVDRDAAFYLLPSRMVELGIGAALVWIEPMLEREDRELPNWVMESGAWAGLGLIIWPMFVYDHYTPFPGVAALWPCLGTALFILFSRARFAGAILRIQPAVFIGKISYSLYLVHWPIIVFYTLAIQAQPNTLGKLVITFLSVMLGWLQYQYIENRFRHAQPGQDLAFSGWLSASAVPVLALSALAYFDGGMKWRIPDTRLIKTDVEWRAQVRTDYCSNPAPQGSFASENSDLVTCQNYRGKNNDIYLWGDSHALHLAAGFARAYPAYNIYVLYMNGCNPQSGFGGYVRKMGQALTDACVKRNRKVVANFSNAPATNLIITSAKRSRPRKIAKATLELLKPLEDAGHRVAFVADFIRPGRSLARCRNVPAYVIDDSELDRSCDGMSQASLRELRYNRGMEKLLPQMVPVTDLQCAHDKCKFYHRGKLLYRDDHHLNIDGSEYFVRKLKKRLPVRKRTREELLRARQSARLSLSN